jgi:hypothetical protein
MKWGKIIDLLLIFGMIFLLICAIIGFRDIVWFAKLCLAGG